jgi:hypothetical protein
MTPILSHAGTVFQALMILFSLAAAVLWAISGSQPLTLTLDAMRDELIAAAWYNTRAAWAACAAALFQALAALCALATR